MGWFLRLLAVVGRRHTHTPTGGYSRRLIRSPAGDKRRSTHQNFVRGHHLSITNFFSATCPHHLSHHTPPSLSCRHDNLSAQFAHRQVIDAIPITLVTLFEITMRHLQQIGRKHNRISITMTFVL